MHSASNRCWPDRPRAGRQGPNPRQTRRRRNPPWAFEGAEVQSGLHRWPQHGGPSGRGEAVKRSCRKYSGRISKVWKRVWSGIWRHTQSETLYERPKLVIDGTERWTFRSLCTASLEVAKKELYHRKSARSAAREGTGDGGVPPHWLTGDGPKLSWLPSGEPAWSVLGTDKKAATPPDGDQSDSRIVRVDFRSSGTSQPSTGRSA